jgi:Ca2+/Na+ antiporter
MSSVPKTRDSLFRIGSFLFIFLLVICEIATVVFSFRHDFLFGCVVFVMFSCLLLVPILLLKIDATLKELKEEIHDFSETQGKDEFTALRQMKEEHRESMEDFRHAMKFLHDDLMRIEAALKEKS